MGAIKQIYIADTLIYDGENPPITSDSISSITNDEIQELFNSND